MKKRFVLCLAFLLTVSLFSGCSVYKQVNFTPYKHVVVIGVDGAGAWLRCEQAQTPNIRRIFADGATTENCAASMPTMSAENWGAILLGVDPSLHGMTNGLLETSHYSGEWPSVFKRIRDNDPDATLASIVSWDPINNYVEESANVHTINGGDNDRYVTDTVKATLRDSAPDFTFVQFDDVDHAGHWYGFGPTSELYLQAINRIDGYVGEIYQTLEECDMLKDTLFIVTADHGGVDTSHGGATIQERYVFFGAVGPGVKQGTIEFASNRDVAAITLFALGYDVPAFDLDGYSAQVPNNLFEGIRREYQPLLGNLYNRPIAPTPLPGSGSALTELFDADKIRCAYFFDEDILDSTGKTSAEADGDVKYDAQGAYGSGIEVGSDCPLWIDGLEFGSDSFTISCWFYRGTVNQEGIYTSPMLYGNKDVSLRSMDGFMLSLSASSLNFNAAAKHVRTERVCEFPGDVGLGWVHSLLVVDRPANTATVYMNFKKVATIELQGQFANGATMDSSNLCLGMSEGILGAYFKIDDFVVFDGAFNADEIALLQQYYK